MSADTLRTSDTALGDWYVNRIVVDRRPLLLLVSSTSLLPILVPARAVRGLPARLASVVDARLRRLGLNDRLIVSETGAMETVMIGPTIDRSVLGIMVDFAKGLPHYLEPGPWDETALIGVEQRLAETPCRASQRSERVIFPDSKALSPMGGRSQAARSTAPRTPTATIREPDDRFASGSWVPAALPLGHV